jgi:parallel beta-helix repeat protein
VVRTEGRPILRRCQLYDAPSGSEWVSDGLYVTEGGLGRFEDCRFFANANTGVHVQQKGNPRLINCHIYGAKKWGVQVEEQGLGVLEECQIYGNADDAVIISTGGDPTLLDCTIRDAPKYEERLKDGVYVLDQGRGTLDGCRIYNNANAGVHAINGGSPTIRNCTILKNKRAIETSAPSKRRGVPDRLAGLHRSERAAHQPAPLS